MPFGAIFGTLFYLLLALWLVATVGGTGPVSQTAAQLGLAIASVGIAGGLLLRRTWARWAGVAVAGLLTALVLIGGGLQDPAISLAVLLGAVLVASLLLVPATGDMTRDRQARKSSGADRVFQVAMVLGLVGVTVGLGWSGSGLSGEGARDRAARQAVSHSLQRVVWSDFGTGLERARAEGKPLLVSFETSWCGYCRKMNKETWGHPEVVDRLGELVAVRVDAEDARERAGFVGRDLAAQYRVSGYPSILLLDADGRVVDRTGGFQPPRQFLSWLENSLRRVGYDGAEGDSGSVSGV
jgi:thiol-disulfide isomerase/thioredoxin